MKTKRKGRKSGETKLYTFNGRTLVTTTQLSKIVGRCRSRLQFYHKEFGMPRVTPNIWELEKVQEWMLTELPKHIFQNNEENH